jgi:protein-S-isoprenylcysteine O-methyltransferase Ste14
MTRIALPYLVLCLLFALEEFVLIRPVVTVAQSDPLSRRVELLAIWVPAIGMALTGATLRLFGGLRLGGRANLAGVVLCLVGLGLRYWSRRVLGRFFTIGVVRQEGHIVVRDGPYQHIRHPAYLAFILFYCGLAMVTGSLAGLATLALPALLIFPWLTSIEDRRMEEELGAPYAAYRTESARLVPGLW